MGKHTDQMYTHLPYIYISAAQGHIKISTDKKEEVQNNSEVLMVSAPSLLDCKIPSATKPNHVMNQVSSFSHVDKISCINNTQP